MTPLPDFLRRNNCGTLSQTYLSRLQICVLSPDSDRLCDDRVYQELDILRVLRLFHRLPSIRTISAGAISYGDVPRFGTDLQSLSSEISAIHMRHVCLSSVVIAAMIRMPKALKEFLCTTGCRESLGGGHYVVFPEVVGRSLWCQRRSLTTLDLDLDQYLTYLAPGDGEQSVSGGAFRTEIAQLKIAEIDTGRDYNSTTGSLHDFERLSHLSIGIELLSGPKSYREIAVEPAPFRLVDALPPSLGHLTIRG